MTTRIRDQALLDGLEVAAQKPWSGTVWRSVKEGRDPLICWRSGGRWDDGTFDVLYTSVVQNVAIEERKFHLLQGQPLPPSKVQYELHELKLEMRAVIELDIPSLETLGLDTKTFGQLSYVDRTGEYPKSQDIAEACFFLGADGILVPSARDLGQQNLIVFCDQKTGFTKSVEANHGPIDWGNYI